MAFSANLMDSDEILKTNPQKEPDSTSELIALWKKLYTDQRPRALTFTQETIRYRDGLPADTSTWYEAIEYPDRFRIDFNDQSGKNFNIYRNDSVYAVRKGKMVRNAKQVQDFLIIEGALYHLPVDSTLSKLRAIGVNPELFDTTTYQGRQVYIIGANKGDVMRPQIWVDVERRYTVRQFLKGSRGELTEARFDGFTKVGDHWVESRVQFFVKGALVQTEYYHNIDTNPETSEQLFDPKNTEY